MKTIIISQPKAGTYLAANLLQEFGLTFSGIHINNNGSYKKFPLEITNLKDYLDIDKKLYKSIIVKNKNFEEPLSLIHSNCFAVGHLQYDELKEQKLQNFKKILITRPFEDFNSSKERFIKEKNSRVTGNKEIYDNIVKWGIKKDVFSINFYDIININSKVIDNLQKSLFNEILYDSEISIMNALKKDSLTKSSIRK